MSYTDDDAARDAYYEELRKGFAEDLKNQSQEAVKGYLARHGDAVDQRVLGSISEGRALHSAGHPGPAICTAAIAIELMIRFMLVRPLIQGAFLSDQWAEILTNRVATGRTADDRELVPAVLRQWGLDITQIRTSSSKSPVWEFTIGQLFPTRHLYVHRYDPVEPDCAAIGLECR
jgi:hypothetical protein